MSQHDSGAHRLDQDTASGHRDNDTDRSDGRGAPGPGQRADEQRVLLKPAKTSAAAVFSLVFGLSALLSVLTLLLAPLAFVLAIVGIVLGFAGLRMARRVGVTGKGVAIGGLVLSVVALLLAITAAVGVTTFLNNDAAVNRLEQRVQDVRDNLPTKVDVPTP